uniref:Alpha-L-glutamate ligase-related protein ATP-grasp domain-containing protein n=1 Tax=viral metagenome TaxID=1070528 RepID=A0A6C0DRB1_9ZZZZ
MFLSIIKFVLINLILSLLFIDARIFRSATKLLYTHGGADFLTSGYNMEYDTEISLFYLIFIRLLISLYLIFSVPVNLVYVAFTAHRYNAPWYNQLYNIIRNPTTAPMFECSWLSGMNAAFNDHPLFLRLQDKIFWNDLFEAHGALTPKIVGTVKQGKIVKNRFYTAGGAYIVKPIVGGLGNHIALFNEQQPPTTGEFIIQEQVIQKDTKGHFRIVTLFDGKNCEAVSLYMCINGKDKLASNNHAGGRCHDVDVKEGTVRYMREMETDLLGRFFSKQLLKQAIVKSTELHKALPNYVVTVGWDVMITDNGVYFLEGNVPSGTVLERDRMYYEKAVPINKMIYDVIFSR